MIMEVEVEVDASLSQETPRIVGKYQTPEEAKDSSLRVSEGAWPCGCLDFRLLDFGTVTQ